MQTNRISSYQHGAFGLGYAWKLNSCDIYFTIILMVTRVNLLLISSFGYLSLS